MTDEDRVRRALDYEIEPWTPDTDALMSGGRKRARARRGAVAGAALAVAVTMTGAAVAVDRAGNTEPPVADAPRPLQQMSTPSATRTPWTPMPAEACDRPDFEVPPTPRVTRPATPRVARPATPRVTRPATPDPRWRAGRPAPSAQPTVWLCAGSRYPSREPRTITSTWPRPTTPVPTSVSAGK